MSTTSAASLASSTENPSGNPSATAWRRNARCAIENRAGLGDISEHTFDDRRLLVRLVGIVESEAQLVELGLVELQHLLGRFFPVVLFGRVGLGIGEDGQIVTGRPVFLARQLG